MTITLGSSPEQRNHAAERCYIAARETACEVSFLKPILQPSETACEVLLLKPILQSSETACEVLLKPILQPWETAFEVLLLITCISLFFSLLFVGHVTWPWLQRLSSWQQLGDTVVKLCSKIHMTGPNNVNIVIWPSVTLWKILWLASDQNKHCMVCERQGQLFWALVVKIEEFSKSSVRTCKHAHYETSSQTVWRTKKATGRNGSRMVPCATVTFDVLMPKSSQSFWVDCCRLCWPWVRWCGAATCLPFSTRLKILCTTLSRNASRSFITLYRLQVGCK